MSCLHMCTVDPFLGWSHWVLEAEWDDVLEYRRSVFYAAPACATGDETPRSETGCTKSDATQGVHYARGGPTPDRTLLLGAIAEKREEMTPGQHKQVAPTASP
jgi:hypothetical protein